jgi:hypothetical protein
MPISGKPEIGWLHSLMGNGKRDDGLPGAAKNTGDDACLLDLPPDGSEFA